MRLFLACLAVLLSASLPRLGSAEELRVILPPEAFRGMPAVRFDPKATGYWQPSFEDVDRMEDKLKEFLLRREKGARSDEHPGIQEVPGSFSLQRRQYVGLIIEGKRILHGNFLGKLSALVDAEFDWKTQYIGVDDGGPQFWRVHFRSEDSKFIYFDFNGHA